MSISIEVVYENGVFRPLQPVHLPEHQLVTLTFDEESVNAESASSQPTANKAPAKPADGL
jgi:predicted DNA-binding antitoxin AbrB/MazE fold protein